jgi:hypothetical protein
VVSADLDGGFAFSSVEGMDGLAFSTFGLAPLIVLSGSSFSTGLFSFFSGALPPVSASDIEVMSSSVTRSSTFADDGVVGLGDTSSVWDAAIGVDDAFLSVDVEADAVVDDIEAGKDGRT